MDSMLLLHLFAEIIPQKLQVISVDHQLQAQSSAWAAFVHQVCQRYQIPCQMIKVAVDHQGNLEKNARQARYQALTSQLKHNDVLVLAHHQQDQAETVILRMLQGSGVQGLSAMRHIENRNLSDTDSYVLWRPLLDISRQKIDFWVNNEHIEYITDPMNHDVHYDRVWCRETLWQLLEHRFPKMQEGIVRSSKLMQDAYDILGDVLQNDLKKSVNAQQQLMLDQYLLLSSARQRQLLSYWMQAHNTYRPPLAMVEKLQQEVIYAKDDAQSVLHYAGYYFMRFDGLLYRYTAENWQQLQAEPIIQHVEFSLLELTQVAVGTAKIIESKNGIDFALLSEQLRLIPREGGEKIIFYGRKGHRVLKKELQAKKIAPWLRHQTQILMCHDTILGVFTPKGFWLADSPYVKDNGWLPTLTSLTL